MKYTKYVVTIEGLGVVLGLAMVGFVLTHPDPVGLWLLELGIGIGIPAALVYAGFEIGKSDFDSAEQWVILKWTMGGILFVGSAGFYIVLHQTLEGAIPIEPTYILLLSVSIGAIGGVYGGMVNARSLHRLHDIEARIETAQSSYRKPRKSVARLEVSDRRKAELVTLKANDVRRAVLEYFANSNEQSATLDELVTYWMGLEETTVIGEQDVQFRQKVAIELHHMHLPKLEDAAVVRYDFNSKTVEYVLDPATENWLQQLDVGISNSNDFTQMY